MDSLGLGNRKKWQNPLSRAHALGYGAKSFRLEFELAKVKKNCIILCLLLHSKPKLGDVYI